MDIARSRTNRRVLVTGGASTVATFAANRAPLELALAQTEGRLIALLLIVEWLQIKYYEAILDRLERPLADSGFPQDTMSKLESILTAERAHAAALDAHVDIGLSRGFEIEESALLLDLLHDAAALENLATAAYAGVIPRLEGRRSVSEVVAIHSVEARQAAWMAALVSDNPFPEAFDAALSYEEVRARLQLIYDAQVPEATPQPTAGADQANIVAAIAHELSVAPAAVTIDSIKPRNWPDSSLGCPRSGEVYLDVITPGFLAIVEVGGKEYEFHADERGNVMRCP